MTSLCIRSFKQTLFYLQILDYLPIEAVEKVVIYDSSIAGVSSSNTKRWEIEKDLVDFPILSSSAIVTIRLTVNGQLSGRLAFAVSTSESFSYCVYCL